MLLFLLLAGADGGLIHSMDDLPVRLPKEKARVETVDGKRGKAVRFNFDEGCRNAFCMTRLRGTPEWDQAEGFSFWVKGDGSRRFGGLQFIWNEDYAVRYDLMFPIDSTEWRKITVAWSDLTPAMPPANARFLDPKTGNAPSKLSALWFGKWWYWRDYGAHSFAIDEIRLEDKIARPAPPKPEGDPLARVKAKLRAGKPVTIVTMGDSLTDYAHWANRETNWPTLLAGMLKEKHGGEVRIVNPAIGGTQLRQGLVLMPRWVAEAPGPDLVTICYGYNDWSAGMRGEMFRRSLEVAVDRVRRATHGKTDVLLLTTLPALERWETMEEMAGAVRAAAAGRNAGLADTAGAFHDAAPGARAALFCRDKVHLGADGHRTVAETVAASLARR